ncbi:hypothetical protein EVAR_11209_1 [Eumeta japonica]|uniref:Uncharacterized protein n=1 Tax=Eumeta variegata TaxID=151549 RepID=A0A4C1U4J5_EUMVA|nr:hypothetical protein EVAR_11209_1 [Eumeta japonica]
MRTDHSRRPRIRLSCSRKINMTPTSSSTHTVPFVSFSCRIYDCLESCDGPAARALCGLARATTLLRLQMPPEFESSLDSQI